MTVEAPQEGRSKLKVSFSKGAPATKKDEKIADPKSKTEDLSALDEDDDESPEEDLDEEDEEDEESDDGDDIAPESKSRKTMSMCALF